ncbi:DUF2336 domain-containing protein [Phenylobacterium montanum]|uniref:DUF2336 domain-containing protein n=1 Tax=Phenylobacterium montanum TaxID=2823693 RepID=A0A975FWE8_9CAUL|nr:DUF2336 domain-containing protein [Caulobacter sp. S6]QUD86097.1 DUF2336 domain-containing protein [Caulobacter sp. S6]
MNARSKLHDLIELAQEPSSERRRELLREVTDMFFVGADPAQPSQMALFDQVMTQLTGEMEAEVRAELAGRMADHEHAPRGLMRTLAQDEIAVAEPVLARSSVLTDSDLILVAKTQGQGHLTALSRRSHVPEAVSDVIVERGDDRTLDALLRNEGAVLSRSAHETAVDRASANPGLHEAVVQRQALPADLLNEMYFVVEAKLRDEIMRRNAEMDPAELNAALEAGRKNVATRDGALPPDFAAAEKSVKAMIAGGGIAPQTLAAFLRNGETTKFLVALAEQADIDFHTARRILDRRELDALAIVCKAANFDRPLFLTFAVLVLGPEADAMGRAREYGQLYTDLPREAANRTLRFWRMRRNSGDLAA